MGYNPGAEPVWTSGHTAASPGHLTRLLDLGLPYILWLYRGNPVTQLNLTSSLGGLRSKE